MRRKAAVPLLITALMLSGCLAVRDEELDSNAFHTQGAASETEMTKTSGEDIRIPAEESASQAEVTQERTTEEGPSSETETTQEQSAEEETAAGVETTQEQTAEELTSAEAETVPTTAEKDPETQPEAAHEAYRVFSLGRMLSDSRRQINARTINEPASHVVDLFSLTFTAPEVRSLIESYAFPGYTWLSGHVLTEDDRLRIEENRNLPALSNQETSGVTYGILMENAAVRSFPTDERLTGAEDNGAASFDYFQESLLFMGEPVMLLHTSLDGRYTFVQGLNYNGWVRTECIQVCDALLAQAIMQCTDFVVITDSVCEVNGQDNSRVLRMGTTLPLLGETEQSYVVPIFCNEQEADGCFAFSDGELLYYKAEAAPGDVPVLWACEKALPKSAANAGYMEFTAENVLLLAGHMLGNGYSWGDESTGYDCSSTVGSIYRCFGIILPRNSGILKYTGAAVTDLTGMTAAEKRSYITALPPGTILVLPGHAMMYLGQQRISISGQEQDGPAMLHCVTGYVDVDGVTKEPYACVKTSIDIHTRGEQSYLELMNVCISFQMEQAE